MKRTYSGRLFVTMLILGTIATALAAAAPVRAANLEVYGGAGGTGSGRTYTQGGVNFVWYEGRRSELYVGAEVDDIKGSDENSTNIPFDNKVKVTGLTFGARWKMALSSRWSPYLFVGGIAGKVDYSDVATTDPSVTILSKTEGSTTFIGPRGGLGVNVSFGDRFGIGLEANATGVPAFNLVIANPYTGTIDDVTLKTTLIGGVFRLRYAF